MNQPSTKPEPIARRSTRVVQSKIGRYIRGEIPADLIHKSNVQVVCATTEAGAAAMPALNHCAANHRHQRQQLAHAINAAHATNAAAAIAAVTAAADNPSKPKGRPPFRQTVTVAKGHQQQQQQQHFHQHHHQRHHNNNNSSSSNNNNNNNNNASFVSAVSDLKRMKLDESKSSSAARSPAKAVAAVVAAAAAASDLCLCLAEPDVQSMCLCDSEMTRRFVPEPGAYLLAVKRKLSHIRHRNTDREMLSQVLSHYESATDDSNDNFEIWQCN